MAAQNRNPLGRLAAAAILLALVTFPAAAHQAESTQPVLINSTPVNATGTVAELTVRNPLTGVMLRYFGLKLDQGGSYALNGTGLDTLSDGSRINVTGTFAGNVFNVSLFGVVAQTVSPTRVTAQAQVPKTITGTLAVYHKDFFDQGRGEYGLAVRDAFGEITLLNVPVIPDSLEIGMLISVDGTLAADGTSLDVSSITILAPAPVKSNEVAAAPTTNNVLVMLIKFTDSPADPFTPADVQQVMVSNPGSVANYYNEVSYGQHLLNITVTSTWLVGLNPIPDSNGVHQPIATPANCAFNTVGTLADAAATAAGYNVNNYQNRYYVMPYNPACGGWAGLAYVGWGLAWSNGYNALWVYGHELGHNFGLYHSGSINCGAKVLGDPPGDTCGVSEYGDPFDIMGNIRQMHFNSMQKATLNWIPSTSVKSHTWGTQIYQLSPLESGGQTTYAVKIPATTTRTYWVEFRQPIGFDSPLSSLPNLGAQIRVSGPPFDYASGADDTEILDMTPGSGGGFDDAALLAGNMYRDNSAGVTINVLSANPSAMTVRVILTGEIPLVDLDATHTSDLVWHNPNGQTAIWLMSGLAVSSSATIFADPNWTVTHTADLNGDGKSDLIWRNSVTGQTAAWLMNGLATTSAAVLFSNPNWAVTFTGDFNGDGQTDLVWRNSVTGQTAIWLMNGLGAISSAVIFNDPNWVVTQTGDFNGDGKTDLVWRNGATGQTAIWLMNGLTPSSSAVILADPNWTVTHTADLNGDGKTDLVWRNSVSGQTSVWLMNGLASLSTAIISADPNLTVTHTGDFNGDGKTDLVFRNTATGQTSIWLMNGTTPLSTSVVLSDPNWAVTQTGDFNGDRKTDLVWRNNGTGQTAIWLMNGAAMSSSAIVLTSPAWSVTH
jgi:Gametolysin peptidase M11/FG-GAP-like repeat/FG-GAP repeat